jgi:hypothetical protein
MLHNLFYFTQNDIYFIILSFFCSNNTLFIHHELQFKHQPGHLKVKWPAHYHALMANDCSHHWFSHHYTARQP